MPCDQDYSIDVDFVAADRVILQKAVDRLGWKMIGNVVMTSNGAAMTLTSEKAIITKGNENLVNELRVTYTREMLQYAATKMGFMKVAVSENRMKLKKGM